MKHPSSPPSASLAALVERYRLSATQHRQLAIVLTELVHDDAAPTTVRDPASVVDVHLADSLAALEIEAVRSASRLADVGAGAGFPGLPLAIALPHAEVRLVESQSRKCAFMQRLCQSAEIANARVVGARVEEWRAGFEDHDVILARALAPQPVVLEYAGPPLRIGGVLVDWRGRRDEAEESAAVMAASELGLRLLEIRRVEPYDGVRDHHLHVYVKDLPTPARFPRRAGIARKRPLGARIAPREDRDRR